MNRHLITCKNFCFLLFPFYILIACKQPDKQKDITEVVKSTAGLIDKNITAEVKGNVVLLRGEVADETTKTAVLNAIKHIEGVKKIESYVVVKTSNGGEKMREQDLRIKASIDSALKQNNISGVDITVSNGEVTLSGQVSRPQEVEIMKVAGDAHPAGLKNALTVTAKEN